MPRWHLAERQDPPSCAVTSPNSTYDMYATLDGERHRRLVHYLIVLYLIAPTYPSKRATHARRNAVAPLPRQFPYCWLCIPAQFDLAATREYSMYLYQLH